VTDDSRGMSASEDSLNMYDCSSCPKCASKFRYPMKDGLAYCDECGFKEPLPEGHYAYVSPPDQKSST
jgi:ribosomal protein L37AE/L43A